MNITKNSKFLIWLGKKLYTTNPESLGAPCSAEEFYGSPVDRRRVQPLLSVEEAGKDKNMQRALLIDTIRRNAMRHVAIATVPYMLCVYLVFSGLNAVIKPSIPTDTVMGTQNKDVSAIGAYAGGAFSWIKVHTLGYVQSDGTKLKRAKELNAKLQDIRNALEVRAQDLKSTATSKEDLKEKMKGLQDQLEKNALADSIEFNSLNGDARICLEKVKQDADVLKAQFANGSITQQQFDEQKAKILEDQKKYQEELN